MYKNVVHFIVQTKNRLLLLQFLFYEDAYTPKNL